jgi:hypothetical protein
MKIKEDTKFIDKVVDALRKAATEIEEFQVKATIGKADAQDKFEEIKKKFNLFLHDSKLKINEGKEKMDDIHTKFDELRVQLSLGKAQSIEAFKEQKKKILLTLHDIEVKIKTNEKLKKMYAFVLIEIEKFKINLEILEQKFYQGTTSAKTSFKKGKNEFNQFIDKFNAKYHSKEETKWQHFQGEISEAFSHLKQAFSKP